MQTARSAVMLNTICNGRKGAGAEDAAEDVGIMTIGGVIAVGVIAVGVATIPERCKAVVFVW